MPPKDEKENCDETTVSAYAAPSATEPLAKTTIERRDPGPQDVAFDIHFAGICHSDIHTVKGEWGQANYPLVPGHEIAGVVTAVGSEVTKLQGRGPRRRWLFRRLVPGVQQLPGRRGELLQARHDRYVQRGRPRR